MPLIAALTLLIVYGALDRVERLDGELGQDEAHLAEASRCRRPRPSRTARGSPCTAAISGPLWSSGSVSSALTNSLWFHFGPSALARKSVLHGVEQPHALDPILEAQLLRGLEDHQRLRRGEVEHHRSRWSRRRRPA